MNKAKQMVARRDKQSDFVSRLTFIRGLKDASEQYVYREQKNMDKSRKEKKKKKYNQWCMPAQPGGYIKCRAHDFF